LAWDEAGHYGKKSMMEQSCSPHGSQKAGRKGGREREKEREREEEREREREREREKQNRSKGHLSSEHTPVTLFLQVGPTHIFHCLPKCHHILSPSRD
jgi:hypothetical protein